ncbi:2-keto-4-pentenoate hydratase [Parvibaculum sedimenti]|uniref:2-keto-4-pentenoate hydratase n=2 Tax=Parvibaculum sedimenti TaxID=2608632 RepID=A0A6N6VFD2_9HYPH|nr:2-keto-4-pentenoate hydratase [Parvibaculum sedimenti]
MADALYDARRIGKSIPPLSATYGLADPVAAYGVQDINTGRWVAEGRRIVGRKIGLTSKAVQQQLGVSEPDYGMLWGDLAYKDGDEISVKPFLQPRIEAEIAFVMESEIRSPDATLTELMSAIGYALASVEIVDSAIADWKITLADTIADNASAGGFALGTNPRKICDVDLKLCGMLMSRNGVHASLGVGAACLGHPLVAALWLARKMAEVGRPLEAGDIVLSGALGPMVSVAAGDYFTVEIQGFSPFGVSFVA